MLPRLNISENRRFLVASDGSPFFWLGDTAWFTFHYSTHEEAQSYFETRQSQGYTVVQCVILRHVDKPNRYGEYALVNGDPAQPNPAYFKRVDAFVQQIADTGLYVGLLPTWGHNVTDIPELAETFFNDQFPPPIFTEENAYTYGRFVGERYRDYDHVVWVLGGDRPARLKPEVWGAMAKGIREAGATQLMTFHPMGPWKHYSDGHSSGTYHEADWLDFNMLQTSHGFDTPVWEMIEKDYALEPPKPVFDAEPLYEDIPRMLWDIDTISDDYDVRRTIYRSVFAGGFGITYGHSCIYEMRSLNSPTELKADMGLTWQEALYRPAGVQMVYLRRLMESRPMLSRIPDQSIIVSETGGSADHIRATRCSEGYYAFVYLPKPKQSVTLDLSCLSGESIRAWWYDPRSGQSVHIGDYAPQQQTFITRRVGPDWVLVLDDASQGFDVPGLIEFATR